MAAIESIGVAALGWVASPIVKDLVGKSITYLGRDIAKGLDDLETTLIPQLQITIKAAQNSPHADLLNKWLVRLKTAYFDAEAVLHDLEYERLKRQIEGEETAQKRKKILVRISSHPVIKPLTKLSKKVSKKFSLLSPQKRKLLERLNKLKEVAAEAKTFRDLLGEQTGDANDSASAEIPLVTTALLPQANKVFGRDKVRDRIIDFLLQEDSSSWSHYSVVAITGAGGAGKTTLAQYVYNDEKVIEYFGGKRMWFSLSHENNINIRECTKEMIMCLSGQEIPYTNNETKLQTYLIETLSASKAVFLVFDDVWYDKNSEEQWETLLKPFCSLQGRCKIVITSRLDHFPFSLHPVTRIPLEDLAIDDFLELFRWHSFRGLENIIDTQSKKHLSEIGDEIAQKMCKSPLAAKVVGNQLHQKPDIDFWLDTKNNVGLRDTMGVLRWSYERLELQLQRCYLFCAVFPQSVTFVASEMVQSWVALDFIQNIGNTLNENRSVEDIGLEYFNKMVANSMFQLVRGSYKMHDMYHHLAEMLSTGEWCRIIESEKSNPKITVQHMFINTNNENLKEKLSSMPEMPNLRSLFLGTTNSFDENMNEIFSMISTKFKNLRVLEILSSSYRVLPTAIGSMRNLRYLDVSESSMEELPEFVSQLYHLQYLILPESIKTLPVKLSHLRKLQSIEKYGFRKFNHLHTLPPIRNIGKLTSIQNLSEFHVTKEEGCEVGQLGSLSEIGCSLRIVGLESVRDKNDAVKARLIEKTKLEGLELVWDESAESRSQADVVDALQPQKNLQLLTIDGYKGSSYPTWLQKGSCLQNLREIKFCNCNELPSPLPDFQQFRHCSKLVLENLGSLTGLSEFSENLDSLTIKKCPCLILVRDNELPIDVNQGSNMEEILENTTFFLEIKKGVFDHEYKSFEKTGSLENCRGELQMISMVLGVVPTNELQSDGYPEYLRSYYALTRQLLNRAWWICHQQRMDFIFKCGNRVSNLRLPLKLRTLELGYCCISDGALSDCLKGRAALEELRLEGLMTITTFPPAQVLKSLESLRVIKIKFCWCLRSLGGLHALPRLQQLRVKDCYSLETRGARLPPSLESFKIEGCYQLDADILSANLPHLQKVFIYDCHVPYFLSFVQLTSLKELTLGRCPDLSFILDLLPRPLDTLSLMKLPNLYVESIVQCVRGCRELRISSMVMLNQLLSSKDFLPPEILKISCCKEETIAFQKSDHLRSIKILGFNACESKNLPTSLSDFSALEIIAFKHCPKISELPILPISIRGIGISGCPVLTERCKPNGPDWHKIKQIEDKWIE